MNIQRTKTTMVTKWRVGRFTVAHFRNRQVGRWCGTYGVNLNGQYIVDHRWPGFRAVFVGRWEFRVHQS